VIVAFERAFKLPRIGAEAFQASSFLEWICIPLSVETLGVRGFGEWLTPRFDVRAWFEAVTDRRRCV
jgi:hypothetical protein